MKLSYNETVDLIELVLNSERSEARAKLNFTLNKLKRSEGQFYESITKHKSGLKLTTDQWFELLCRLPNRILRSELDLENMLLEEQLMRLPPISG